MNATTGPRAAIAMGLSHCPLCVGLAVLCAVRCGAHAVLLWQLLARNSAPQLGLGPA